MPRNPQSKTAVYEFSLFPSSSLPLPPPIASRAALASARTNLNYICPQRGRFLDVARNNLIRIVAVADVLIFTVRIIAYSFPTRILSPFSLALLFSFLFFSFLFFPPPRYPVKSAAIFIIYSKTRNLIYNTRYTRNRVRGFDYTRLFHFYSTRSSLFQFHSFSCSSQLLISFALCFHDVVYFLLRHC